VEDLLHERGIEVSHETVRFGRPPSGFMFAAGIHHECVSLLRKTCGSRGGELGDMPCRR
jgi:hypothetical protein